MSVEQTFYYTSVCVDFRMAEDIKHTGPVVHQFNNEVTGHRLLHEGFNPDVHGFNDWLCRCNTGQNINTIKRTHLLWHYYPVDKQETVHNERFYVSLFTGDNDE